MGIPKAFQYGALFTVMGKGAAANTAIAFSGSIHPSATGVSDFSGSGKYIINNQDTIVGAWGFTPTSGVYGQPDYFPLRPNQITLSGVPGFAYINKVTTGSYITLLVQAGSDQNPAGVDR